MLNPVTREKIHVAVKTVRGKQLFHITDKVNVVLGFVSVLYLSKAEWSEMLQFRPTISGMIIVRDMWDSQCVKQAKSRST